MSLSEEARRAMGEMYEQRLRKPVRAVTLPCSKDHRWLEPAVVQLDRTGDQRIACPICGKVHYLTWSKVRDNLRWSR